MDETQVQDRPTADDVAEGTQALERIAPDAAMARAMGQQVDAVTAMSDRELGVAWKTARALAASGFFKDARQPGEAFAKILLGRDLGLSPFEAMSNLHIIEGKVEAASNLHAVRVREHPEYDYEVIELTKDRCVLRFTRNGEPIGDSEFSMEDARLAKLDEKAGPNAGPGTFKKYPRNMLFARAMTNGVAWYCPEVMGTVRVYAPGEIDSGAGGELGAVVDARTGEPGFDWQSLDVSDELRERLRSAIERANELAPGEWPVAKIEMTFTGRSEKQVETLTRQIEKLIEDAEAERPVDAEVVPDEERAADAAETVLDEDLAGGRVETPPPASEEDRERAAGLQHRAEELRGRIPLAQSDRETEELQAELDSVEEEIRGLIGESGQSSLGIPG